MMFPSYLYTNV